jgi:hypothetical protein
MVRKSLGNGAAPGSWQAPAAPLPYHSGWGEEGTGDIPRSAARTRRARVDVIGAILVGIAGILAAAFSKQVADEFKAWTPRLTAVIVRCALRRLREDQRGRYAEEWQSHIEETPGEIGKLVVGLGLLPAARKLSRISPNPDRARQIEAQEIVTAWRDADRWSRRMKEMPSQTGKFIFGLMTMAAAQKRLYIMDEYLKRDQQIIGEISDVGYLVLRIAAEEPGDPFIGKWAARIEESFVEGYESGYRASAAENGRDVEPLVLAPSSNRRPNIRRNDR